MIDGEKLKKFWFGYITFLIFWMVLTFGDTLGALARGELFVMEMDGDIRINDFLVFYNSGTLGWDSIANGINIYDPDVQNASLRQFLPKIEDDRIFFSQNPPYTFLIVMPLARLAITHAWLLWVALGAVLIFFTMQRLVDSSIAKDKSFTRIFCLVATFASFPAWLCMRLGQISLLAFPAITMFWFWLSNKRWMGAGILAGCCLLKLQYIPLIFLTGLAVGGAQFLLGFIIVTVAFVGISALVLRMDAWMHFPQALAFAETSSRVTGVSADLQQNLRGQLTVLLGGESTTTHGFVTAIWLIVSVGIAIWFYLSKRKGLILIDENRSAPEKAAADQRFKAMASIALLAQLVSSPHTHSQDFLFAALPCLWLYTSLIEGFPAVAPPLANTSHRVALHLLKVLILSFPFLSWVMFICTRIFPVLIEPFFVWALLVITLSLVSMRKPGDKEVVSEPRDV